MASRNLTIEFKNQLARNANYQKVFTDAQIDKAYGYLTATLPYDGFVAGDKIRATAVRIIKGGAQSSVNTIRAFLAKFPESASIDDNNISEQYTATLGQLDEYLELISDVTDADKTTPSS